MVDDSTRKTFSSYARRFEEEKKIRVYFLPGYNAKTNQPHYVYAVASALLHDKFMEALDYGVVPDFAVVVEQGQGEPSAETKDKMKRFYGFDHDIHINTPGAPPASANQ